MEIPSYAFSRHEFWPTAKRRMGDQRSDIVLCFEWAFDITCMPFYMGNIESVIGNVKIII